MAKNAKSSDINGFQKAGSALAHLQLAINAAQSAVWERPPRFRPREDTTERSKGRVSNPTADIATDDLRLQLSEALKEAERVVFIAARDAAKAERQLIRALSEWHGEIVDE